MSKSFLTLSKTDSESLQFIKTSTFENDTGEVVKKALRLYHHLLKEQFDGKIVLTAKPNGKDPVRLKIY